MKKTALALASALLLLTACDSSSTDGSGAGGAGANGAGTGAGVLGQTADGSNVTDRVFFAYDSSVVDSEGQATLDRQAAWLKENTGVNIVLEGHADERGTREYNIALGERRATAAKNYLVSQGVAASRISTVSFGKERPAIVGNEEVSWSQNRRAVTVIAN
jgi:peptidoglycan-associated lipoprotein